MNEQQKKEHEAYLETCNYLYHNPLTGFLHRFGHWIAQSLSTNPNGTLIDIGCGRGDHFPYIKNKSFVGFDIDTDFLELAKKKYPHVALRQGTVYDMPFKDGTFDTAIAFGIFEHLSQLPHALKEIKRILKPNGELIVAQPIENALYKLGRQLTVKNYVEKKCSIDYNALVAKEHINSYATVLQQLKNYFKISKKRGVPFFLPISEINIFMVIKCVKPLSTHHSAAH